MTKEVPKGWPARHRAGDTLRFDIAKGDFDPIEDTLNVYLSNQDNNYTFSSSENGDYFRIDLTPSNTSNWQKGYYTIQGSVTCADGSVFTIHAASFEILANLTFGNADPRSHARKVLEAIESVIEGTASSDVMSYEINNRRLDRYPIAELLKLRSIYRRECQAENSAPNFIKFGFK